MTGDERRASDGDEDPDGDADPDAENAATGGTGTESGSADGTPDRDGDRDENEDATGAEGEDGGESAVERVSGTETGTGTGTDSDDGDAATLPSEERYGERREEAFTAEPDRSPDEPAGEGAGDADAAADDGTADTDSDADADADSDTDVEWADETAPDADPEIETETDAEADADAETDAEDDAVQSDGGAAVGSTETRPSYEDGFVDTTDEPLEGPASDEEMPLADHIEEMVSRLGVVILAMSIVSVLALPFSVEMINFIWYSILGSVQAVPTEPRIYRPLALVLARLKVATLVGFVAALPVFVYETYLFMRPGLYQHERRYYLAAVPTSLVLAFIGVAFAFYLVLPALFTYFVSYTVEAAGIAFGLTDTFGLMLLMMGFFAAVFQIPLLIMLAVMMGLTTRRWLVDRRLYFWGGFLGIALLFSPDPTGMAPIIVALTMVGLFEGTLLLLRWTDR